MHHMHGIRSKEWHWAALVWGVPSTLAVGMAGLLGMLGRVYRSGGYSPYSLELLIVRCL